MSALTWRLARERALLRAPAPLPAATGPLDESGGGAKDGPAGRGGLPVATDGPLDAPGSAPRRTRRGAGR